MLSSLGHHFLIYKCRSLSMIIVSLKEYSCFAKMVCQFLKNVNKELQYDPKIPLLDIHWRVVVVVVESLSCVQLLQPHGLVACQAPLSMDSLGKNTWVGCHSLLQGIFLTQELNPRLLHWGRLFTNWATRESHIPKRSESKCLHKNVYTNVHRSIVLNGQKKVETTQLSVKWINQQNMVYPYNRRVFNMERKWSTGMCYNTDEPCKH